MRKAAAIFVLSLVISLILSGAAQFILLTHAR